MGELPYKIQQLKLKRIEELNSKLRNELARERMTASNACLSIIDYTSTHSDYAVPEVWGFPTSGENPYDNNRKSSFARSQEDSSNCCVIS
ncbi:unnamed protein product [Kluyveromyces dobzhanskii CBS 2104]|uniref:Guanine nucleotide-binding protein subunit gamma n=1 Tax=Kluyveromyces dobzhanskii CBS 2104 TaxID=1427455 RepID=A0A0A8L8C3_9SACH|nr:unnamed protein product [Kluyveromyces dobzhanskii CBS 2104]